MASSTELLWRCLGGIAERWRRERDIRDERGGLFDQRDSRRLGYCPEHGAAIPEYAGGDAIEAAAVKRARQYLKTLGLKQAVEILDNTLR